MIEREGITLMKYDNGEGDMQLSPTWPSYRSIFITGTKNKVTASRAVEMWHILTVVEASVQNLSKAAKADCVCEVCDPLTLVHSVLHHMNPNDFNFG